MIMRKSLVLFVLNFVFLAAFSQYPGGMSRPGSAGGQNLNVGHFYGKLVDAKTNKGIEAVTVLLVGNKFDTATKKMKEVVLGTLITKANGDFSFENLSIFGNYKLKISAIGFKAQEKPLSFGIKMPQGGAAGANASGAAGGQSAMMQQMLGMADKDLGNIKMEEDATKPGKCNGYFFS